MRRLAILLLLTLVHCSNSPTTPVDPGPELLELPEPTAVEGACASSEPGASLPEIGCFADFESIAGLPLDASIPGAVAVKVVLDRADGNKLYFVNNNLYPLHYTFAVENLSGNGLPLIGSRGEFSRVEYYQEDRRFILATVTYYEEPRVWALELFPSDSASAELIALLHRTVTVGAYFGPDLVFHPNSDALLEQARQLPDDVPYVRTDTLFAGVSYQALNLGESLGRLRFVKASSLSTEYLGFRDIVVLDRTPNDISAVAGIITSEFQTPLSHINVLSQNRGTPNMALRHAFESDALRELDGEWVRLRVGLQGYDVEPVSFDDAEAWWEANKPPAVGVPRLDRTRRKLIDVGDLVVSLASNRGDTIKAAIPAYGGKAAHYALLSKIPSVPVPEAFAVPVFYYLQFMEQNGFDTRVRAMLDDDRFRSDPQRRDDMLAKLREDMRAAPVDAAFAGFLEQKLRATFPNRRVRFRSSTNAEDLEGFTGAGLYTSVSGKLDDRARPVLDAVREVWSSVWYLRAFEEREYRSVDHMSVGMALLVHCAFLDEEANGVALTASPFDEVDAVPSFYVNVQVGEESVVKPRPGVTTDQYIHYYHYPGKPLVYLGHSSLTEDGQTVLSVQQTEELGDALNAIHRFFASAYDAPGEFYAMDVEFKFDDGQLWIKQARPHPGRGQ